MWTRLSHYIGLENLQNISVCMKMHDICGKHFDCTIVSWKMEKISLHSFHCLWIRQNLRVVVRCYSCFKKIIIISCNTQMMTGGRFVFEKEKNCRNSRNNLIIMIVLAVQINFIENNNKWLNFDMNCGMLEMDEKVEC